MGLFSAGNSKSTTTNNTNNSGFSDIHDNASIASVQGSNNVVNMVDNGAVKSAFDFAKEQSSQAYDFSRDVSTKTATQIGTAIKAVSESARSESENILINLQKYAVYAFIVWGAVQVFKGVK